MVMQFWCSVLALQRPGIAARTKREMPQEGATFINRVENRNDMKIRIMMCIIAIWMSGYRCESQTVDQNDMTSLKDSAEQGDAVAQFNLGYAYYRGEGTLMDKKQAFYW